MQVLSEATPMTNGEVYALLRRRRDERNAARHPPFGLQPVLTESPSRAVLPAPVAAPTSSSVAPTTGTGHLSSSVTVGSVSGRSDGSLGRPSSRAVPAGAVESASAAAAAAAAHILASPASGHLVVLLTEVTVMNYLLHHASLVGRSATAVSASSDTPSPTLTVQEIYGPTSVYDDATATLGNRSRSADGADNEEEEEEEGGRMDASLALLRRSYADLRTHRPGTVGHVRGVQRILDYWEAAGRAQERRYAFGIRHAVQRLHERERARLSMAAKTGGARSAPVTMTGTAITALPEGSLSIKLEPTSEDDAQGVLDALAQNHIAPPLPNRSLTDPYPSGAFENAATAAPQQQPSHPSTLAGRRLAPLLAEPTPLWGARPVHGHGGDGDGLRIPRTSKSLLSAAEVLQLVVSRPQCALDVYRMVDDIDSRLHYDEQVINAFVEALTAVFTAQ